MRFPANLLWRALRLDVSHPALVRAQAAAFARQLPLLYAILGFNTLLLACAFVDRAPALMAIWAPLAFCVACGFRGVYWWGLRRSSFGDVAATAALLRKTVWMCVVLGWACSLWACGLSNYGDTLGRAHVAFYMAITVTGCIFCLMNVPLAACALTISVAAPFCARFAFGDRDLTLMVVNGFIVFAALLAVMMATYRNFLQLINAREELLEGREEQARLNAENLRLADLDHLTRLPNRRQFFEALDRRLREAAPLTLVVALIDLDGFKPVNDVFGHAAGDHVLVEAAARLTALNRGELVARLGGDEFAVILAQTEGDADFTAWAESACRALSAPYDVDGAVARLSGSVGLSGANGPQDTARTLVERADYALYSVKRSNPGGHSLFNARHDGELRRTALIGQGLRGETLVDELSVVYQPIVDSHDERVVAVEALARWTSPTLGVVPPAEFVAIAEQIGLVSRLTTLLLQRALTDMQGWPDAVRVSFNLSAHDLVSDQALTRVVEIVQESGIAHERLDFEITETALIRDLSRASAAITRLREQGFGVSLDDFGTGHSSLSYVHRLALNKIKIDRSFIQDIGSDPAAAGVVKTVIDMCRNLGLICIVEGVETHDQVLRLRQLGARHMQGYLFGRPETPDAVTQGIGISRQVLQEPAVAANRQVAADPLEDIAAPVRPDRGALSPESRRRIKARGFS